MKKVKFPLFVLMLFILGTANATDYYISTSGSNANNGTTQATPWQTMSKLESVCNNGTIKAGDNIYFKKGDNFTGTLMMTSLWGHNAKSGTATQPITFTSYGTGAKPLFQFPQGSSTRVPDRIIMQFIGVDYIVVDGFNFTDLVNPVNDKFSPAHCGFALYFGIQEEATSNYCIVKNVDISLLGMGIAIVGDNNTVTNSSLTNFKDLVNSDNGGSDDYGANAFTLTGNNNNIINNYIAGCWAYSSDYGWNGGACEMYNTCNGNKIMYNTIVDCEGISEYGGVGGTTAANNLIAYNKIINCGTLTWVNTTGTFAMQASNIQYFNNVIVENNLSRFSGPNTGSGNSHPLAQYPAPELFAYNGTPNATTVFNLKNNIFFLGTGIDVVRTSCAVKTIHQDNIYRLSGAGTPNFTLLSNELSTTTNIFSNITAADPTLWDYSLASGSPAIDFGQYVGIAKDFVGNNVPNIPNAGILESAVPATTFTAIASATAISCNGGTTVVTVSASGGIAPYTGTGSFTVYAGTYNYTVIDAAGFIQTASITIAQPVAIGANVIAGTIPVLGGNTTVSVTASGGTSPYTFSIDGSMFQSSNTFPSILAGSHTVSVKDSKGCSIVRNINISQPGATNPLSATYTNGTINCNGTTTTITITASGGTSPYTGTGTFTVGAGSYNYTIIDAAGMINSVSVVISEPTAITASVNAPNVVSASATTTATVTATGGTPGYTYSLNAGSYSSSNTFSNVAAGTHSIKIKDSKGCIVTKTFIVTVMPSSPLTVSSVSGFIGCHGGSTTVTISASGGVAPYIGTGVFTVTAGQRDYVVTDASGASVLKTVKVVQPKLIVVSTSNGTIATYAGKTTATISATGGTGAYKYKLNSGSYQSSGNFSNLSAGSYTATVKDARNCTSTKTFTITQPAQGSFKLTLVTKTNLSCVNKNDGTITVSGAGGTLPYTFKRNYSSYSSNNVFTNLNPGNYTITGKDAAGVTSTVAVTILNSQVSCTTTRGIVQEETISMTEEIVIKGLEINAFPNPSKDHFSLIVKSDKEENINVVVMNLNGQKVYETNCSVNKKVVFGDGFVSGIYFVRVMQGNKIEVVKLIKSR